MNRWEYLIRRLGSGVFVVLGVLFVTFIISRVLPGDPASLYLGHRASAEKVEEVREELGLNDPMHVQFVGYVSSTLRGEFGYSFFTKRLIIEDLKIRFPATMELVILSMLITLLVGVPVGVLGAARRGNWFDKTSRIITISGVSIPVFLLALLMQLLFFLYLDWLPLSGRLSREVLINHPIETISGIYLIDAAISGNWIAWKDALLHLIMPVSALAVYPISLVVRMTRASMIDILSETYVVAARASGLSERKILFKLALKNGIIPTLNVMGLLFAYSIIGAVLIEIIFTWPGMGSYMTNAILNSDIYVLFGVTIVITLVYIFINIIIDFIQALLDPRVRLGERGEG